MTHIDSALKENLGLFEEKQTSQTERDTLAAGLKAGTSKIEQLENEITQHIAENRTLETTVQELQNSNVSLKSVRVYHTYFLVLDAHSSADGCTTQQS